MKRTIHLVVALTAALLGAIGLAQEPKPQLVLKGDINPLRAAAFSDSGAILATRNGAGVVTIWNAATGKPITVIKNHPSGFVLALSGDGKFVYTGGTDTVIKVWDAKSGKEVRSMKYETPVSQLALSPDGKRLASGHQKGGDVVLWDATNGKQLRVHKGSADFEITRHLAFSPDGKLLVAGKNRSQDNLFVWDAAEGKEIAKFTPSKGEVYAMALSPDGKLLATPMGSFGGKAPIKLWDTSTWKEAGEFDGNKRTVYGLAFDSAGTLYSRDESQIMKTWDVASKTEKLSFPARGEILVVSKDGKTLAASGGPSELRLFKLPLQ
jgi:WD40 repeat protein